MDFLGFLIKILDKLLIWVYGVDILIKEEKVEYKARYRKKGINPILSDYPKHPFYLIESYEIPKDIPIEQIEEFAKENTPEDYIFIEVISVEE